MSASVPTSGARLATLAWRVPRQEKDTSMNLTLSIGPWVSLLAGILILMVPRLLNYIVAVYLIVIGLIGLLGAGNLHL
jgi:hypothetical protein